VQAPLSTQGPGSGVLSGSSTARLAGQCTASQQGALHWHLCATNPTALSLPGAEQSPGGAPPRAPRPRAASTQPRLPLAPSRCGRRQSHTHGRRALGTLQPLRGQGTAPSAAGPCPELLGRSRLRPLPRRTRLRVGMGQTRRVPPRGPAGVGSSSSLRARLHPDPRTPQPRRGGSASAAAPRPPGDRETLAPPAAPRLAPAIQHHLIFRETGRERMLVSLSS